MGIDRIKFLGKINKIMAAASHRANFLYTAVILKNRHQTGIGTFNRNLIDNICRGYAILWQCIFGISNHDGQRPLFGKLLINPFSGKITLNLALWNSIFRFFLFFWFFWFGFWFFLFHLIFRLHHWFFWFYLFFLFAASSKCTDHTCCQHQTDHTFLHDNSSKFNFLSCNSHAIQNVILLIFHLFCFFRFHMVISEQM